MTVPMTMPDRVFLSFDTDRVFTHVSVLATFRMPDSAPGFVDELMDRLRGAATVVAPFNYLAPAPRPRRRWRVLDDRDIDLGHHVRHTRLDAPGTRPQLERAVAALHSRPLDPARPLWEFHVIDGLAGNRFALCAKVHHSLMDGTALIGLLSAMTASDPDVVELTPIWSIPLPAVTPAAGSPLTMARELAGGAWRFIVEGWRRTDPAFAVPLGGPRSRLLNGRLSTRRSWATADFAADRIRRIADRAGASVNEVLLVALSAALRRYLADRSELPERGLIAGVPVASRSQVADPRHNAGGMILVNLFTDVADPYERLQGVLRSSAVAKRHFETMSPPAADRYAVLTFGPFMIEEITHLSGRVKAPFNVTVSNVAGPGSPRYLLGAAQDGLYAAANLGHGQRLNMTVMSACGQIGVGFTGCGEALADLDRLAGVLTEAVSELEAVLWA